MKIADIRLTGLAGGTVEGGWAEELDARGQRPHHRRGRHRRRAWSASAARSPASDLVAAAVEAAAAVPDRRAGRRAGPGVSEKLRQHTFWQGRGGAVEHAISGIDIALWDLFGKVTQPARRPAARRHLPRRGSSPTARSCSTSRTRCARSCRQAVARGFKAIKLGWRPFGRRDAKTDELLVRTARETVGPDVELMVDAGGSDAFWPHGYKWALRTAQMLAAYDVVWFEEALPPDDLAGFVELRRHSPVPIATGEVLTRRQSFRPFIRAAGGGHHPAGLHQVRRADRGVADRVDGLRAQRPVGAARLEHGRRPGRRPAPRPRRCRWRSTSSS